MGTPDDVADAVLFLACRESSFVTGQVLRVDGGTLSQLPHVPVYRAWKETTGD
jgi:NAD(P)-dependent dehydrogenase (short-subunit alcohol dehydrogenase family)